MAGHNLKSLSHYRAGVPDKIEPGPAQLLELA